LKVSVAGSGYASLVIGACLAEMGNIVTHYLNDSDLDPDNLPFHEPGLANLISSNSSSRRLVYSNEPATSVSEADVVFIALEHDASVDEKATALVAAISPFLVSDTVVVNSSPTSLGTTERLASLLVQEGATASVVANPLFLREGVAIDNFMSPDRIILGVSNHEARTRMLELYRPFMRQHERVTVMSELDAELTRFAASAMLATRISLMNEIAAVAEKVGADIESVRKGIGSDPRIGYSYLYPGVGYGGFCLPGDLQALSQSAADSGVNPVLLNAVSMRNSEQQAWAFNSLKTVLGELEGRKVAIWGLAFRPETSDVSGSSAIVLIRQLLGAGAVVSAYDPLAMSEAKKALADLAPQVEFSSHQYDCLTEADALVLMTEWKPFRQPDFNAIGRLLCGKVIIDGRNQYDAAQLRQAGFEYRGVGRGHRE